MYWLREPLSTIVTTSRSESKICASIILERIIRPAVQKEYTSETCKAGIVLYLDKLHSFDDIYLFAGI